VADEGWLSSLFASRSKHRTGELRFELVVLEGEQQGERFPIRYDRMLIGRRTPDPSRPHEICLSDRSVSLRQATLEIKRGRVFIEHLPGATNPTIVNRRKIERKKLKTNDVIVLGLVILELHETVQRLRPEARLAAPEPAATLIPPDESARDIRPEASVDAEAKTWLDVEAAAPADREAAIARSSSEPAAPGPEDETVIGEPNPTGPETPGRLADAPLPEDDAATLVQPPPASPPAPERQGETAIDEPSPAGPETPGDLADTPLPEDDAATVVRPPPTPGHQDETMIVESNDPKPES
jgi:pSer/pThr/pTyr-binding forkhead associated (FHA) protein